MIEIENGEASKDHRHGSRLSRNLHDVWKPKLDSRSAFQTPFALSYRSHKSEGINPCLIATAHYFLSLVSSSASFADPVCNDCHCRFEKPMILLKALSLSFSDSTRTRLPSMDLNSNRSEDVSPSRGNLEPCNFRISAISRKDSFHISFFVRPRLKRMPDE